MGLFNSDNPKEKQHSGILGAFSSDVIKWEPETEAEASIIAHRFEYEDFPNHSYLSVAKSQIAVFRNNLTAGNSLEADGKGQSQISVFIGPCNIRLETGDSRFAPFRNIAHSLTGGESAFHSTVYFINATYLNDLQWGTQDPIKVEDPEEGVNVHVRAFGLFGVHIEKIDTAEAVEAANRFLDRVVGERANFTKDDLIKYMRAKILEYVPTLLAQRIIDDNISVLKISAKISEFSQILQEKLTGHFADFGITLDNFSFTSINVPDSDLEEINKLKIRKKQKQLEAEGNAAQMDIESEARARMREREGYSYQQERTYDVMETAAGNDGSSGQMLGTGLGLSMGIGVGGAIGGAMNAMAGSAMGNVNNPANASSTAASPAAGIKCASCGNINPADSKFCFKCGEKLSIAGTCPSCGKELVPGAVFCPFCGQKLVRSCANCGAELPEGALFCAKCGTKN
ncbi:MAG: SPFH domain-containing protein [Lachnospiraceae bacterium]|nr:SPFH domain-containing protein [Lachnospiraceae bacterium]